MTVSLPVILGTVRSGNATRAVAEYTLERLREREDATTTLLDPGKLGLGNLEERIDQDAMPTEDERGFLETVSDADGFVLVTPEYNHGYPGALKNALDHLYEPWQLKAFGIVTTGGSSGGVRAEEQLRLVLNGGLKAQVVPRAVNVPRVREVFDDDGPAEKPKTWQDRFDRLAERLAVYARAMRDVREELAD